MSRKLALRRTIGVGVVALLFAALSAPSIRQGLGRGEVVNPLLLLGCAVLGFLMTWSEYQSYRDPHRQITWKRLASWGTPDAVSAAIERQLAEASTKMGDLIVTRDYLLHEGWFTLSVRRFGDLLWAYKLVTTRRVGLVVPISRRSDAILKFVDGDEQVAMETGQIDRLLQHVTHRAPWAPLGFLEGARAGLQAQLRTDQG